MRPLQCRSHAWGWARARLVHPVIAVLGIVLVASPLLFTQSGFAVDFTNHLWLAWVQGQAIAHMLHPSLFVHTQEQGVFYPQFAFYGGTLYAIAGAAGDVIGNRPVAAFTAVTVAAIASAYGGFWWLSRQLGLRGLPAHAPALVFVTSAYYVTNLYGRGDWPEFVATSMIPLVLASGLYLVRRPSMLIGGRWVPDWSPFALLAFVGSVVVFSGSHNITLLWGVTVMVALAVVLRLAARRPAIPWVRVLLVGALAGLAVGVNAWFLATDVVHAGSTGIAQQSSSWDAAGVVVPGGILLTPFRPVPYRSETPGLFLQAPVWFMAWGLAAGAVLWRLPNAFRFRRFYVGLVLLSAVLLVAITTPGFWAFVPSLWKSIQFPSRLISFLTMGTSGVLLVALMWLDTAYGIGGRMHLGLRAGLLVACAASIAACVWQLWVPTVTFPESYKYRWQAFASVHHVARTWYDHGSFNNDVGPVVPVSPTRKLTIDPGSVRDDRVSALVVPPPGTAPTVTNIPTGPYLVRMRGLLWLGRDDNGRAVVRRLSDGSGPVHLTIDTAPSLAVRGGWIITCVSLLLTLLLLVATAFRHRFVTTGVGRSGPARRT